MATCPQIVQQNHPDIELSSYDLTEGTYVVIGCRGFGRHIADPTNVLCLNTGAWSTAPNLACSYALDDREKLLLGVGVGCAVLALIVIVAIMFYFCICHGDRREKYYRWNRYFMYGDRYDRRYEDRYDGRDPEPGKFNYNLHRSFRAEDPSYQRETMRETFKNPDYSYARLKDFRRNSISNKSFRQSFRQSRRNSDGDRFLTDQRDFGKSRRYSFDRPATPVVIRRTRRNSDPSNYGDIRQSRKIFYEEDPVYIDTIARPTETVKIIEVERPQTRIIERVVEPEPIIRYVEPEIRSTRLLVEPEIRSTRRIGNYRSDPYIVSSPSYVEPAESFVSTMPRRSNFSIGNGRLDPLVLNDDTIYLKYDVSSNRGSDLNGYLPRANVVELEGDSAFRSTTSRSKSLMPMYQSRGHYEPIVLNPSTNYFFGRQDFSMGSRTDNDSELDHVLYHGKGKMTEIYDDGSDFRKSRIL